MHGLAHDELRALKSLEGEVARYEEHISAREPPRRGIRILRQVSLAVLIWCIAVALVVIVRLQSQIIDLEATQREMTDSIAEMKATQEELQALQKNEQPSYWYSHLPSLLFQNPVPQRPDELSR